MKTKKRSFALLSLVLTFICSLACFTITACKDDPEDVKNPGPETGVYYFDASGDEYLITLNDVDKFAFVVNGENRAGIYSVTDGKLALTFNDGDQITVEATIANDVITLTYGGAEMKFLKKVNYTVTFNTDGGSSVDSVKVVNGKTLARPADPVREGSAFLGWFTDNAFTSPFAFDSQVITADTTLYARWGQTVVGQAEYEVSFNLGYTGAENPAKVKTVGGKLYNTPAPSREGYTFGGWWVSMYNTGDYLSYPYTENTVFDEDTTLFALWQNSSTAKTPSVTVSSDKITWDAIVGVGTYHLNIKYAFDVNGDPAESEEFTEVTENLSATTKSFDFSALPAGGYLVTVAADNNTPCQRLFVNKALKRVSNFEVVEPSTLVFNKVDNAENYYITVECGNKNHNHTKLSLGNSNTYNFANCPATDEGFIYFTVNAAASGFASSESARIKHKKMLAEIDGVNFDNNTETLVWNAVPNASNYVVTVAYGSEKVVINNGNKTSFCVKEFAPVNGGLKISVYPATNGYKSSKAVEYTYAKATLATPTDIRISDTTLSWAAVAGATKYEVNVGGVVLEAEGTSLDLNNPKLNWEQKKYYTLSVRAIGANNSLWSDAQDIRYYAMFSTLSYGGSVLSWGHVVGSEYYEVQINDNDPFAVTEGKNFTEITFTQPGENVLSVRFVDGNDKSPWVSVNVYAYTVALDSRGGSSVEDMYKAIGDKMNLPESSLYGYKSAVWYNVPGGAESNGAPYTDEYFVGNGDLYLYAYYEPNDYTVSFETGVDGISLNDTKVKFNRPFKLDVPSNPDVTKVFGGWYSSPYGYGAKLTDGNGKSIVNWPFAEEATLYAYWIDLVFDYTFTRVGTTEGYMVSEKEQLAQLTEITIPERYGEFPVIMVAPNAFSKHGGNLVTVHIPNTVMAIDPTAFNGCEKLQTVDIVTVEGNNLVRYFSSDGVLFDYGSFDNQTQDKTAKIAFVPYSKTGTFVIPDSVVEITAETFMNHKISAVTIPASVTAIGTSAFKFCTELETVTFIEPAAGKSVSLIIGDRAFWGCTKLSSITLPSHLSDFSSTKYSIMEDDWNGGDSIEINNEVRVTDSFYGCTALSEINVSAGNANFASVDGVVTNKDKNEILYFPAARGGSYSIPSGVNKIAAGAFLHTNIKEVTIPAWVTDIGECAFARCEKLTDVSFTAAGGNAVTIGKYAFRSCALLRNLTFDAGCNVQTISQGAFMDCAALRSVTVPAAVKVIEDNAFRKCTSLTDFKITDNPAASATLQLGKEIVGSCSRLENIYIPRQALNFPENSGLTSLKSLVVSPENPNFQSDETGVRYNSSKTVIIQFPATGLTEYVVPENIIEIGNSAFKNSAIKSITISKNVTKIGEAAFSECLDLEEVIFEAGGTEDLVISAHAFSRCPKLSSVTLPARTSELGDEAFSLLYYEGPYNYVRYHDTGIEEVKFEAGIKITTIGKEAFVGAHFTEIEIPKSIIKIDDSAFYRTQQLQKVTFEADSALKVFGDSAFSGSSLTEITIPKTVTEIYPYAFYNCNKLATLEFEAGGTEPLNLDILYDDYDSTSTRNGYTFSYCSSLTELTLPSRTVAIGQNSFSTCTKLTKVAFAPDGEESNLKYIGEYGFYSCSGLTQITLPKSLDNQPAGTITNSEYTGPEPYARIAVGKQAFYACTKLEVITFEAGGTGKVTIGKGAFRSCSALKELILPSTLAKYQLSASEEYDALGEEFLDYSNSALKSITVGEGNEFYASFDGVLYTADFVTLKLCPPAKTGRLELHENVTTIGEDALYNCSKITTLVIPAAFPDFSSSLFADCTGLENFEIGGESEAYVSVDGALYSKDLTTLYSVPVKKTGEFEVPATVTTIATGAFKDSAITTLTFAAGDADLTIEENAFKNSAITAIALPARLTTLGEMAFMDCKALETLTFADGCKLDVIPDCAFVNCAKLKTIRIPAKVTALPNMKDVEVPSPWGWGTTLKSYSAFSECSALESVTFEDGSALTTIGSGCFKDVSSLKTIAVPSTVTTIGKEAFSGCNALESIVIPAGVTKIEASTFNYCTSLTTITFAEGSQLTEIGKQAFYMAAFESFTVPAEVVKICESAFYNCEYMTQITFAGNKVAAIEKDAFFNCKALTSFTLPALVNTVEDNLLRGCESLESVTLHDGITRLGEMAFYNCVKLTELDIPVSVTTLVDYCLSNTGLKEFTLPTQVKTIPNSLFANCESLTTVNLHSSLVSIGLNAFAGCTALKTINIPQMVSSIGAGAFANTAIETFTVNASNDTYKVEDGVIWTKTGNNLVAVATEKTGTYTVKANSTILKNAFRGSKLSEVILESGVTVNEEAFYGAQISKLTINGDVTIELRAFNNCRLLETIEIGSRARNVEIKKYAFNKCSRLAEFVVDNSRLNLTIAESAFEECSGIQKIDITASEVTIGKNAFYGADVCTEIKMDAENITLEGNAFYSLFGLETVEITATGSVDIGEAAFRGYYYRDWQGNISKTVLKTVEVTAPVISIGYNAFNAHTELTQATFTAVDKITVGGSAFAQCSALEKVSFTASGEDSVITFGNSAFYTYSYSGDEYCKALSEVTIVAADIQLSGYDMFRACKAITSFVISENVSYVGNGVFYDWTEDQTIYVVKTEAEVAESEWNADWLDHCNATIVYGYKPE